MNKRQQVLQLLQQAGTHGVTTGEFLDAGCGSRFGARIQELRDRGMVVDVHRLRSGSYCYALRTPDTPAAGEQESGLECATASSTPAASLFAVSAPRPLNALLDDWAA